MRDFTTRELEWRPWVTPVDLDAATQAQLTALKVTPSNRAVGAYSLVLAHDPEALSERSPLYNGIMFGAKGLPRAELRGTASLLTVPLHVSGTVQDPLVRPTKSALAGAVAGSVLLPGIGTAIGLKASQLTDKLFGGKKRAAVGQK